MVPGNILNKFQMSQWHLSRQQLSMQHLSISGICQLLMTQFIPNFKSKFLGPSLTDANPQGDTCSGNICQYQQYLSYYWPDLDKKFCTQFLGGLLLDKTSFDPNSFLGQQFVYLHFLSRIFLPKIFCIQNFLDLQFFWITLFLAKVFFTLFFSTQFFLD